MSQITLSKAVRSNLLNLQSTATMLSKSQERLSSGLQVNTALDNPTNFFTAQALNSRANDLSALADAVSNAVQTVAAADQGITAISKLVESAQATARQALQSSATVGDNEVLATTTSSNASYLTISSGGATVPRIAGDAFSTIDVSGGNELYFGVGNDALGWGVPVNAANVALWGGEMSQTFDPAALSAQDLADILNHATENDFSITVDGGRLVVEGLVAGTTEYVEVLVDESNLGGGTTGLPTVSTRAYGSPGNTAGDIIVNGQTISLANDDHVEDIVSKFQTAAGNSAGSSAFTVGSSNGVLTLTGTGGNDLDISGDAATLAVLGLSDTTIDGVVGGGPNPRRAELVETYNDLLSQIDAVARDSGFNGVNLLNGDDLSVLFNEDGSSKLEIDGATNSAMALGLASLASTGFDTNSSIDSVLGDLKDGIETLRAQSAKLGANLSVVETRQSFTAGMIDVLLKGAANLTLADANGEAANVLALQTRQQLSSTALSLASQADQNVLRLF